MYVANSSLPKGGWGGWGDFYSIYMLFRNIVINIFVTNN